MSWHCDFKGFNGNLFQSYQKGEKPEISDFKNETKQMQCELP